MSHVTVRPIFLPLHSPAPVHHDPLDDIVAVLRRLTAGTELEAVTPPLYGMAYPLNDIELDAGVSVTAKEQPVVQALAEDLSARLGWRQRPVDRWGSQRLSSPQGVWTVSREAVQGTRSQTGVECASPKLRYSRLESIKSLCDGLTAIGCVVNTRCGMHVHVGGLTPAELLRLALFIYEWEECIYQIAGPVRRLSIECRPLTLYYLSRLLRWGPEPTREQLLFGVLEAREDEDVHRTYLKPELPRKYGLNLCALKVHGTAELRYFPATLDGELATATVRMCMHIAAAAVGQQPRVPNRRTHLAVDQMFETIGLSEADARVLWPLERRRAAQAWNARRVAVQREESDQLAACTDTPLGPMGRALTHILPETSRRAAAVATQVLIEPLVPPDGDYGD